MNRAPIIGLLVVVASLLFTGCSGETLGASNIERESATLNGHGRTETNVGAYVWYEYGKTTSYGSVTPPRYIPPGASGDFPQNVTGLNPGTQYHFRLCGRDLNKSTAACANDQSFYTLFPSIARSSNYHAATIASRGCHYDVTSSGLATPSGGSEGSIVQVQPYADNAPGCAVFWCIHDARSQYNPSDDYRTCGATNGRSMGIGVPGMVREYTTLIAYNPNASGSRWSSKYCLVSQWYWNNPRACSGSAPALGL